MWPLFLAPEAQFLSVYKISVSRATEKCGKMISRLPEGVRLPKFHWWNRNSNRCMSQVGPSQNCCNTKRSNTLFFCFLLPSTCQACDFVGNQFFFVDQLVSESSGWSTFIPPPHPLPNALSPVQFSILNWVQNSVFILLIDQWKHFIVLFLKNYVLWLDGYISPLEIAGQTVGLVARFCVWLLIARLCAIAYLLMLSFSYSLE